MAISLSKKPIIREYTPEHIRDEEETLPRKLKECTPEHIALEPERQILTKSSDIIVHNDSMPIEIEDADSDLTVIDMNQLCNMIEDTTNEITALNEKLEKLAIEAKLRAKNNKDAGLDYIDWFYDSVGTDIANACRKHKLFRFIRNIPENLAYFWKESIPGRVLRIILILTVGIFVLLCFKHGLLWLLDYLNTILDNIVQSQ